MVFIPILQTIVPVFLIILVGYIIGKFIKINIQPMVDLIVYLSAPCLIFSSISRSNIDLIDFFKIASSAVFVALILWFFVFLILRTTKSGKVGLYLPMVIGNTGYLGYPVALFSFGVAGLSRAVVYDMMNSLLLFSFGIYIVHHRSEVKEIFKVPLIYSVVVGLFFSLLKISIPELIFKPIQMIGSITIPLALLVLGYKLTETRLSSIRLSLFASLFRIFFGFLVALFVINLFSVSSLARKIILFQASMPSAVMSMILCQKYKRNADIVASVVLVTTLIGLFSIPFFLYVVQFF